MRLHTSHATLIAELVKREIEARYRGSALGLLWSLGQPLLLLCVYTWVFTAVLKGRWGEGGTSSGELALLVFTGLLLHGFLVDVLARAPLLIPANSAYVKKVVFPLEILPAVATGSALFHLLIGGVVLIGFELALLGSLPWTALGLPAILAPFAMLVLGIGWLLAAAGVYFRDIAQVLGAASTALMFLSPVLYPASALPDAARPYLFLNPLTFVIEQTRDMLIWGRGPDLAGLAAYATVAACVAIAGFATFRYARRGFADAL